MIFRKLILFLVFSLLFNCDVAQAGLGLPTFSGEDCSGSQKLELLKGFENRFRLGLQLDFIKKNSVGLVRKKCAFRMPVKLGPKEKLVIKNIEQDIQFNGGRAAAVKSSLEFFLVGKTSKPLVAELRGLDAVQNISKKLQVDGILAESKCGQDAIVAGNLSAVITGLGQATVMYSPVLVSLEVIRCY